MSDLSKAFERIAKLETQIGSVAKYNIPMQEYIRPEIITFTGYFNADSGTLTQPSNYFTVNADYWLYVREIHTGLYSTGEPLTELDRYRVRFNLKDSGRGYNFFSQDTILDLFRANTKKVEGFNGILLKPNANLQASISLVANLHISCYISIICVGDLIAPNYLNFYFAKRLFKS